MDSLAFILFFVFLVCLIWGLIKPSSFKWLFKNGATRKALALIFLPLMVAMIIAGVAFAKGTPYFDNIKTPTNQKVIRIKGTNAFNNASMKIYLNDSLNQELKSDSEGKFNFELELREGENKLKAESASEKGKVKMSSEKNISLDLTPPQLNIEKQPSTTETESLNIKGESEKNAEIKLFRGSDELKKLKTTSGKFDLGNVKLIEGENKLVVKAYDLVGNESQPQEFVITFNKPKKSSEPVQTATAVSTTATSNTATVTPTPAPSPEQKKTDIPQELDGNVTYSNTAVKVDNNEELNWFNCRFKINSTYTYATSSGIKAKDSIIIPYSEFTKGDGTRFNNYQMKMNNLYVSCDSEGKSLRYNYFTINQ